MTSAETFEAFSDEWGGGGGKRGGQAAWALMLEWRRWLMTQVMCHTPSYKRELLHFVHTNIITHTYRPHTGLRGTFVYYSRSTKMKCKFVPAAFRETGGCVCQCVGRGWRGDSPLKVFTFTFESE